MTTAGAPAFQYQAAVHDDLEALVALRIEAMRESLERVGRFDPMRARERFAAGFEPSATRHIVVAGQRVGFVVVKLLSTGLLLDHLYLRPTSQGHGIGSAVLRDVLADADRRSLPIDVGALKGSAANRFYVAHGFAPVSESEWDVYYRREPRVAARAF
jgi:GNAT superfamily N-acetyltransferase